jgi:cellulose synthase/poly-beta-1,6-N-acetylglucosamine synthase-like glycosyltransferase
LLTGSGMAFPWTVIRDAHLATGSIVEDTQLSIDLLLKGHNPIYCAEAEVSAMLPAQRQAILSQRTRWEHGHLQLILTQTPRLMWGALTQRRPALLAAALDVAVPPLSLLAIVWGLSAAAALAFGQLAGDWLAAGILAVSGGLLFMTILCVNRAFSGRGSWKTLAAVPAYIAVKAPIYARFLWRRQSAWVRTAREGNP